MKNLGFNYEKIQVLTMKKIQVLNTQTQRLTVQAGRGRIGQNKGKGATEMKIGVMGGLGLGGLLSWAILGFGPGSIVLLALGAVVGTCELAGEKHAEKQAERWRKNYPSYKY